jgi:hypothetical protein
MYGQSLDSSRSTSRAACRNARTSALELAAPSSASREAILSCASPISSHIQAVSGLSHVEWSLSVPHVVSTSSTLSRSPVSARNVDGRVSRMES